MDDCLQGLIEMSEYNTYWRHREKRRSGLTSVKDIFAVTKSNARRRGSKEDLNDSGAQCRHFIRGRYLCRGTF